jgi:hypothetical protein
VQGEGRRNDPNIVCIHEYNKKRKRILIKKKALEVQQQTRSFTDQMVDLKCGVELKKKEAINIHFCAIIP